MNITSCEGCIFAQPTLTYDDEPIMKCHRYPPQIYKNAEGELCQGYPDASTGCGEFKQETFGEAYMRPKAPYGMDG